MYALARKPEIQRRLREELLAVSTDKPSLDVLNALPYLDLVTREVLRLHTVVAFIPRQAMEDDTIPLGKPVLDRNGKIITHIKSVNAVSVPTWNDANGLFMQSSKRRRGHDPHLAHQQEQGNMGTRR